MYISVYIESVHSISVDIEGTEEARSLHHRKKGKYPAYISLHVHLIVYDGVLDEYIYYIKVSSVDSTLLTMIERRLEYMVIVRFEYVVCCLQEQKDMEELCCWSLVLVPVVAQQHRTLLMTLLWH